jgi:hypothetical protein
VRHGDPKSVADSREAASLAGATDTTESLRCDARDGDWKYHRSTWNGPRLVCRAVGEWTLAATATCHGQQSSPTDGRGFAVTSRTVVKCAQVGEHRLALEIDPLLLPATPNTLSFFPAASSGATDLTVSADAATNTDLLLDLVLDRVLTTGRRATS